MVFGVEKQTNPSTPNKMASVKKYIGSGKSTKWDGVSVTIRVEEAAQFVRETEDGKFLSFIMSPRREPSAKGQTHSAFVLVDGTPEEAAMPKAAVAAEGEVIVENGRRLKRISAKKAAELRAAKAA